VDFHSQIDAFTLHCRQSDRKYDVITCLGVLEHLPQRARQDFYSFCAEFLAEAGMCIIDVPVEHGPALLLKEFGRTVLKHRKSEYSFSALLKALVGIVPLDPRRWDYNSDQVIVHHAGFDYRQLRDRELRRHFKIVRTIRTPLPAIPAALGNQEVIFVCSAQHAGPLDAGPR